MSNSFYLIIYTNIIKSTQKTNASTLNYIKKFLNTDDKLYIVDARRVAFENYSDDIYSFKVRGVDLITINKSKDFFKLIKNNSYCFVDLNFKFNHFFLYFLIATKKQRLIFINNIGYFSQVPSSKPNKNNFYEDCIYYLTHYFSKLLKLLSIFPQVEFYFESSQVLIDNLKNSKSYKLSKLPFLKKLFYFKNIIRINSKYYDEVANSEFKKKEKFIVYIDNGFDHPDRIIRDGKPDDTVRKKYFKRLSIFLKKIKTFYNLPVYFCYHPNSFIYEKNHYFYDFFKFCHFENNSEKYLSLASVAIFQISSLINKAILMDKKIIITKSELLGKYFNEKLIDLNKQIDLLNVDLDSGKNLNLVKLDQEILNKKKKYHHFINRNHILKKNIKSYNQIKLSLH